MTVTTRRRVTEKEAGRAPLWLWIAALALPSLFWSGNFIVSRAMRVELPPLTLSFLRSVLAFAVLMPFAAGHVRAQAAWFRAHWLRVVLIGLPGVTTFNTLIYLGLQRTPATNGLLLNSTIPVLILLLGALFWGRAIRPAQVLGLVVSLAGVAVVILHGEIGRLMALEFSSGDLIILIAMVGWACYTLGLAAVPAEINRLGLLLVHMGLAIVEMAPLMIWATLHGQVPVWTPASVAAVCYIGIFPSVVALLLFMRAVTLAGPALAGQSIHLMPLYGGVLAALFLGEDLHLYHAVGLVAILAGIVIATRFDRR